MFGVLILLLLSSASVTRIMKTEHDTFILASNSALPSNTRNFSSYSWMNKIIVNICVMYPFIFLPFSNNLFLPSCYSIVSLIKCPFKFPTDLKIFSLYHFFIPLSHKNIFSNDTCVSHTFPKLYLLLMLNLDPETLKI